MRIDEVRWNDEARDKIVEDADRVLREAVADLSTSMAGAESDAIFAELIARLKDRFIDFEPGPDIRRYADAIAAGDIEAAE